MNFLRRLLGLKQKPVDPYAGFVVEHYPLTDSYFAKHRGYYLRTHYLTGMVEKLGTSFFNYAEQCKTEAQAWALIDRYREQSMKINVKRITR